MARIGKCKNVALGSTFALQAKLTNNSHFSEHYTDKRPQKMTSLTPTLDSLTDTDLQRLFVANTAAGTPSVRLTGGARKVHLPGTAAAHAWASDNPLHNGVSHAELAVGDDPVRAVRAVAKEGLLGAGPRHWVVGPLPQPELEQALLEYGFVLGKDDPAMVAPLEDEDALTWTRQQACARVGEGYDITPVEDGDVEALADWMAVWVAGWGAGGSTPMDVLQTLRTVYEAMLRDMPRSEFSMFVGRVNGRAVGTGILWTAAGVAVVHFIATLPEFRRRGIGKALTLHAMMLARQFGYRIVMLTASEIGMGVYKSVGFREFGRQKMYLID
jgi:ribosomal protein S18 acetylase RimI-like enzyme